MSPFCEDEDATAEVYDEAAEATAELNRRVGEASYARADMQAHMVNSYADLYYEKMVGRTCIQGTIKEGLVEPMVKKIKNEIYLRLAKTPADRKTLEDTIGTVFDVHRGIETAAKELPTAPSQSQMERWRDAHTYELLRGEVRSFV